jgi:hypothetical protein
MNAAFEKSKGEAKVGGLADDDPSLAKTFVWCNQWFQELAKM